MKKRPKLEWPRQAQKEYPEENKRKPKQKTNGSNKTIRSASRRAINSSVKPRATSLRHFFLSNPFELFIRRRLHALHVGVCYFFLFWSSRRWRESFLFCFLFCFDRYQLPRPAKWNHWNRMKKKKRPENQKNQRTTRQNGEQQQQTETRSGQAHAQMKQCTRIKREKTTTTTNNPVKLGTTR